MRLLRAASAACLVLIASSGFATETLNADAVKKLITGNTIHMVGRNGKQLRNFFATDGKIHRQMDGNVTEGTWHVNDDGTQCVEGMPGGCAKIVRNDDGSYDRVSVEDGVRFRWTVVNGKSF